MYYYFFFIPLGTELKVRRFPTAVAALAAINLAYFLLFRYSPVHAARMGALALDVDHPTILTAFTACFIHADWFHILGNLVFLLCFGPALEDRLGGPKLLLLYLVFGMGAMAAQVQASALHLTATRSPLVLGASGAISGLLGLFAIRCGFSRVKVAHVTMALLQGVSRAGTGSINSLVAIGAWLLLQVAYAFVSRATNHGSVAYASHIGGLALGVGAALLLRLDREAALERIWVRSRRYAERGEWFAAAGETLAYLRRVPRDSDAWLQLARTQRALGRQAEATRAYNRAISLLWAARQRREAVEAARELRRNDPDARIRPSLLLRLAIFLEREGDLGWAANTYWDYARNYPGLERAPQALLRAGEIEARYRNDLDRAREIYDTLARRYPDSDAGREGAQRLKTVELLAERRTSPRSDRDSGPARGAVIAGA